jgi:ADP-ribosylglycohydrolase
MLEKPDLIRAMRSLEGLSLGDAFGQLFFTRSPFSSSLADLPNEPWLWTDDTHMALSIVEVLYQFGEIDQDALAQAFARRFADQPYRGYAGGASHLLRSIVDGADWRIASPSLFGGGSFGNGAAMRAAPIGGCFWKDLNRAANEAQRSAVITHAHPEGQAGAIAVAVAAAIAAAPRPPEGAAFIRAVLPRVPEGLTKQKIEASLAIKRHQLAQAAERLGTGRDVSAQDTVPFCIWSAAYHLDDFEGAMWSTVQGLGDRDTTCAIVGGIVALSSRELPAEWQRRRESLPVVSP